MPDRPHQFLVSLALIESMSDFKTKQEITANTDHNLVIPFLSNGEFRKAVRMDFHRTDTNLRIIN